MRDIFIDACIANKYFSNPPNDHFKNLIRWLLKRDMEYPENNAYLVVSPKLVNEYIGGCRDSYMAGTSIAVIYNKLLSEDRLNRKTNDEIKTFHQNHFTNKVTKNLRCNAKDRDHLPIVFLSNRKMVLSEDNNFLNDLVNFPGFGKHVIAAKSPENIPYNS